MLIFKGLDDIPWKDYGMEDAPNYIRDLVSKVRNIRDIAYDQLLDNYVYENLRFSHHLITYMMRIIQANNQNADIALFLGFFHNIYKTVKPMIGILDNDLPYIIVNQIEEGMNEYKKLINHVDKEVSQAAQMLVEAIRE